MPVKFPVISDPLGFGGAAAGIARGAGQAQMQQLAFQQKIQEIQAMQEMQQQAQREQYTQTGQQYLNIADMLEQTGDTENAGQMRILGQIYATGGPQAIEPYKILIAERGKKARFGGIGKEAIEIGKEFFPETDPADYSGDQMALINKRKDERYIEGRYGAGKGYTRGRGEATFEDVPLTPEALSKLRVRDPITKEIISADRHPAIAGKPAITMKDVTSVGGRTWSDKEDADLAKIDAAQGQFSLLTNMADQLIWATNPAEVVSQKTLLEAGAFTRKNSVAATYRAELRAFAGNLSKAFAGETGVLTNVDINRIIAGMPQYADTVEIKQLKQSFVNDLIDFAREAKTRRIMGEGFDVKKHKSELNILLSKLESAGKTPKAVRGPRKPVKIISERELP